MTQDTDDTKAFATITWTEPVVTDNSGLCTVTSTHNSGDTFSIGSTTVTYIAVDASGNQKTISFVITVNGTLEKTMNY